MDAWPHVPESVAPSHGATRRVERRRARPLPILLTVDETADLLRTTRRAIYAMIERRQLPGVVRVRRRVLLRSDALLHWLEQKCAPSLEER
jgi:excisionase family DNA binding protein